MRTEVRLVNRDCKAIDSVYKAEFELVLFYGDNKSMKVDDAIQVLALDGVTALKLAESLLSRRYANTRVEEYDPWNSRSKPLSTHQITKVSISLTSFNKIASAIATGVMSNVDKTFPDV